ncbi:MAG: lysoplasmalogenase [Chitinophagaceae bacterium]
MHQKQRLFFFLFSIISLIEISLVAYNREDLRFATKPLIVPLLGLTYYFSLNIKGGLLKDAIIWALFFSWLGDILLQKENLFVPGLICFLTAHIFYIFFFAHTSSEKTSFFKLRPVMLIAVLAYLIEFMHLLWPSLGAMKIPVLIYGITISTMLSAAIWQYQKLNDRTALYLIIGATMFVTSDSILAINKFSYPFSSAGIFIMSTYILAQLFIVLGAIQYRNNS